MPRSASRLPRSAAGGDGRRRSRAGRSKLTELRRSATAAEPWRGVRRACRLRMRSPVHAPRRPAPTPQECRAALHGARSRMVCDPVRQSRDALRARPRASSRFLTAPCVPAPARRCLTSARDGSHTRQTPQIRSERAPSSLPCALRGTARNSRDPGRSSGAARVWHRGCSATPPSPRRTNSTGGQLEGSQACLRF